MLGAMRGIIVLLLLCAATPAAAELPGLFGTQEFRSADLRPFPKWTGVLSRHQTSLGKIAPACSRSQFGSCAPESWSEFLATQKGQSPRAQLDAVNAAMNKARYITDLVNWGTQDYWATPSEFFWKDGDCEDYAIAKYVALREAGFPREQMQILLVRDHAVGQDHAVLAARIDERWLILDNRRPTLTEDKDATNLTPLFAVDHLGVQLIAAPFAKRPAIEGEDQAAPAASGGAATDDWGRAEGTSAGAGSLNLLPLLM